MMNDILEHIFKILTDFKNSNQMTYWAYSTLYDAMRLGIQQAYNSGKHDGVEQYLREGEPEKVEGMRHAYGHTDMIGDCPACGLTVYKRINACYCGACGKRIKWE